MVKIMWFSRHDMTDPQRESLVRKHGEVEIFKVNKTITHASEVKEQMDQADVIAVVAPVGLQQEFLKLAGEKPVIIATSERIIIKQANGKEDKVKFKFIKWEQLDEFVIKKHDYA